jgi:hypothetical protein
VIPDSIGKLENLVELGLYRTSLSGFIPSSLGNLTQLIRLYAYYAIWRDQFQQTWEIEESVCP